MVYIRCSVCHSNLFQTLLQSSVPDSTSDVLEEENRSLRNQLDESRRMVSRLGQEKDEISRRLEEREREREALRRGKSDLEEQKRLLDRSVEKINKEVCVCDTLISDFFYFVALNIVNEHACSFSIRWKL